MDGNYFKIKKAALNPLWIITIFFSFTETILGYAVFNTTGTVQIMLTIFVVFFPLLVAISFFVVLWYKPKHLYAPTDYKDDQSFLDSLKEMPHESDLGLQIEKTVNNILTSKKLIDEFNTEKPEKILKEAAEKILSKIKEENFITIDLSRLTKSPKDFFLITFDSSLSFQDLTNRIYAKLKVVKPFTYGFEWVLRNASNDKVYKSSRMVIGAPPGEYIPDKRTLEDMNIKPGDVLVVDHP